MQFGRKVSRHEIIPIPETANKEEMNNITLKADPAKVANIQPSKILLKLEVKSFTQLNTNVIVNATTTSLSNNYSVFFLICS